MILYVSAEEAHGARYWISGMSVMYCVTGVAGAAN